MIEAYKKFWKGYVDFEGRSTRSDYWFAYLANMLTVIAFYVLLAIFGGTCRCYRIKLFCCYFIHHPIYLFCLWCCCHLTWSCCNSSPFT